MSKLEEVEQEIQKLEEEKTSIEQSDRVREIRKRLLELYLEQDRITHERLIQDKRDHPDYNLYKVTMKKERFIWAKSTNEATQIYEGVMHVNSGWLDTKLVRNPDEVIADNADMGVYY